MRLIAHRGFRSIHPENTLEALEAATAVADGIEIDVRRCASGELVVIHDPTIDRIADGSEAVADLTRAELEALDVLGSGAGVPTLAEALRTVPDHVGVNVELKEQGTEADALRHLSSMHPNSIVSAFDRSVLAECRAADPTVPRAYLTAEPGTDCVGTAAELDCEFLHPPADACTEQLVNAAHRAGMSVTAWTVDSVSETEHLADVGVDGVIADRPSVLA
jgi:glycerophosphoryl diester phosphodiesterase